MSTPLRPPEARLSTSSTEGSRGIAVSPHHLASQAGVDVLGNGGNAVDAAIALNAVLGVVLPDTCGPGGDLFALIHQPGDEAPTALNASGRAGSGTTSDDIRDTGEQCDLGKDNSTYPSTANEGDGLTLSEDLHTLTASLFNLLSNGRHLRPASPIYQFHRFGT